MSQGASGPAIIVSLLKTRVMRVVVTVICVLAIIALGRSAWELWQKQYVVGERKAVLARLNEENKKLKDQLQLVQTPGFIEQAAREKLGLVKPGETIVLMSNDKLQMTNEKAEENLQTVPNWKQWWKLFF